MTHSVILENVPQLIIQIVYIVEREEIDDAVTFALISSFFSVIIVVFTYFFAKQIEFNQTSLRLKVEFASNNYKQDVAQFHRQKGYRRRLAAHMAHELGIMPEKIEIYSIVETHKGCIVYIAYAMNAKNDEMGGFSEENNRGPNSSGGIGRTGTSSSIRTDTMHSVSGKLDVETHASVLQMFQVACQESEHGSLVPDAIKKVWKLSLSPKVTAHGMSEYNGRMSMFVRQKSPRLLINNFSDITEAGNDRNDDSLPVRQRATSDVAVHTDAETSDDEAEDDKTDWKKMYHNLYASIYRPKLEEDVIPFGNNDQVMKPLNVQ